MSSLIKNWRIVFYPVGLFPALWLLWEGTRGELGADPVNTFERALGLWAFRFLLLCLFLAPLKAKTGINLLRYRRLFGLLAFFYACFHLLAYIGLDHQFDWPVLLKDIMQRSFIILGMAAFLGLTPLALTSNRFFMKKLGRYWKKLHQLIFPVAIVAAIHFSLAFKTLNDESIFYSAILICLLVVRLPVWAKSLRKAMT
ncbi:protein-methionine-sulfoxide reductase heme-binding subunit MsrQ [Saccharibacter sp. 17.LH.SD]|uniref:protein-methionine-sulfoxide reductase heme-binding subunit MsrQ n=1 Tax=Saccharibacter sp. 17.LH.SD TaxID=2689393 RepID=UPI0013688DB5|nr:protein-methionine-sulfoxide reductase heme-binding subunit MsrQ [Saccharibacter sp. 17.LH.SD]